MSHTPDNQFTLISSLCEKIKSNELVFDCIVNDYGRFGNFEIFITPHKIEKSTTNRLKKIVKCAIQDLKEYSDDTDSSSIHVRTYFAPIAVRKWCHYDEKTKKVGYDKDYWSFDIDFKSFDSSSNSFA